MSWRSLQHCPFLSFCKVDPWKVCAFTSFFLSLQDCDQCLKSGTFDRFCWFVPLTGCTFLAGLCLCLTGLYLSRSLVFSPIFLFATSPSPPSLLLLSRRATMLRHSLKHLVDALQSFGSMKQTPISIQHLIKHGEWLIHLRNFTRTLQNTSLLANTLAATLATCLQHASCAWDNWMCGDSTGCELCKKWFQVGANWS